MSKTKRGKSKRKFWKTKGKAPQQRGFPKGVKFHVLMDERARKLRENPTPAEARLWSRLETHPETCIFQAIVAGSCIADFLFPEWRLVVELDGSVHSDPEVAEKDVKRESYLRSRKYEVIRFQNREVYEDVDEVVRQINEALGRQRRRLLSVSGWADTDTPKTFYEKFLGY